MSANTRDGVIEAIRLTSFSEMHERSIGSLIISFRLLETFCTQMSTKLSICKNSEDIRMDIKMDLSIWRGGFTLEDDDEDNSVSTFS